MALSVLYGLSLRHSRISCQEIQQRSEDFTQISCLYLYRVFNSLVSTRQPRMVMDKGQCLSDWTKRPLSEPQIKYAALDSYIEVVIYEISEKYKTWEEMDPNIVKRYEAMIKNKNEKRERRHHQKEKEQSKEVQPQTQTILCPVQDDSSSDEFINEERNEISSDSDPC